MESTNEICDVCGMKFLHRRSLIRHREVHTNISYQCETCPNAFNTKQLLSQHVKLHDSKREVNKCNICNKEFATKSGLRKHDISHHKVVTFHCDYCAKTFSRDEYCKKHMESCKTILFSLGKGQEP